MIIKSKGAIVKTSKWSGRAIVCILLASCIGILFVVRSIHASLTRMPHIEVVCDTQLTPTACLKLTAWCKEHPEVLQDPQKLVDEFSWIKSCAVRYTKMRSATIRIVPHSASAVLNDQYVLLSNGAVVATSYIMYEPVARFTVHERIFTDQPQRKALVASVHTMAPHLFDHYIFSWRDATACTVTHKMNGTKVVADNQTVGDVKKIALGMELASGKNVADIRFEQQIIVAKKRGGDEIISRC